MERFPTYGDALRVNKRQVQYPSTVENATRNVQTILLPPLSSVDHLLGHKSTALEVNCYSTSEVTQIRKKDEADRVPVCVNGPYVGKDELH